MEGGDCYGCGIFFFLHIKISKLKSEREKLLNDNNKNNSVREEDNSAREKCKVIQSKGSRVARRTKQGCKLGLRPIELHWKYSRAVIGCNNANPVD